MKASPTNNENSIFELIMIYAHLSISINLFKKKKEYFIPAPIGTIFSLVSSLVNVNSPFLEK